MKKTRADYPKNWKEIAHKIKVKAGFMCEVCKVQFDESNKAIVNGKHLTYTVHHIDRDTWNNHPDNLIAVCSSCHCKLELPLIRIERNTRLNRFQLQLNFGTC